MNLNKLRHTQIIAGELAVIENLKRAVTSDSKENKKESEVAVLPTDEELDNEFRMIISHAFLGEEENISIESFNLAIKGCVEYMKNVVGKTDR